MRGTEVHLLNVKTVMKFLNKIFHFRKIFRNYGDVKKLQVYYVFVLSRMKDQSKKLILVKRSEI